MKKQLSVVTGNKHKFSEIKNKLSCFDVVNVALDLKEIQGTAEEVVREKALEAYKILKKPCIVEDVSLGFKEWNYMPGPFIKFFVKGIGAENLHKLLQDKTTRVVCTIGYAKSESNIILFSGEIWGKITTSAGNNGFDFDKIFIPDGENLRFSEMTPERKNEISHRSKALDKLKEYLEKE
jgi:inosine triphosphate pyrophosphatase